MFSTYVLFSAAFCGYQNITVAESNDSVQAASWPQQLRSVQYGFCLSENASPCINKEKVVNVC